MQLLKNDSDFIRGVEKLSLGDLFDLAGKLGDLETGGIFDKNQATLRLRFTGDDSVVV